MSEQRFSEANRGVSQTATASCKADSSLATDGVLRVEPGVPKRHRLFLLARYGVNFLLLVAVVAVVYTTAWEYSTRRYLKGFSDAIIPDTAPVEGKIQSILNWMSSPAAQLTPAFVGEPSDRNPLDTLNFQALLRVCGTATNAFVNLAVSNGLGSRRLLLLDSYSATKHVDAEVLVDGR